MCRTAQEKVPGLFCLYTVYIRTKLLLPVQSALFGVLFL